MPESASNRRRVYRLRRQVEVHIVRVARNFHAGCSEEELKLLSEVLTRVEDRLSLEDIRSHGWLSPAVNPSGHELDQNQELEVAKEVKMSANYFSSLTI